MSNAPKILGILIAPLLLWGCDDTSSSAAPDGSADVAQSPDVAADGVAPDAAQVEAMKAAGCDAQTLVPSTTWQSAFVESGDGSPESEKRAFRRAVDGLAKKRAVLRIGEFACPTP